MADFNRLPRGYKTDASLGHNRNNSIYVGFVKQYDDAQRMGRIAVWIPELGGDPNIKENWIIVRYASPFAGATPPSALIKNGIDMASSQKSYGFWMQPPDVDNQVLVCFVNGDVAQGFWFACVWQQNMNHMVPGLASDVTTEPPDQQKRAGSLPPVVEYNKASNEDPRNPHRPVFTPLDDGLTVQGLYPDPERGPTSASARREAVSQVFGFLTPGGQQVYADDNPNNEFIRLRTKSGAQVLIHETTGYVYINSKEGNSWLEISDRGIDGYSAGSVSFRAEGSLNIHADASLNIEANGNLNMRAGGNITMQSSNNINVGLNGNLVLQSGGSSSINSGGDVLLSASGALRLGAGGDLTQASGGNNVRSATAIFDNSSPSAPSPNAPAVTIPTPQTLNDVNGSGPAYSQTQVKTIVERLPTHEPFLGHPSGGNASLEIIGANQFASPSDRAASANSSIIGSPAGAVNVSDDDLTWLTVCMCTEANGLGNDMLAAVAQVVINRVAINYPVKANSWTGVKKQVLAHFQFSAFNASTNEQTEAIGKSLIAKYQASASNWNNVNNIAKQVVAGTYNSTAVAPIAANKRCVQYLNMAYSQAKLPSPPNGWSKWATPSKFVCEVGTRPRSHSFYLL